MLTSNKNRLPHVCVAACVIMELPYHNFQLQLGTSGDQSLALVIAGLLGEVLDEAGGQILSLLFPDGSVSVGVSGIQDVGVNAGQSGGNFEVEVGDGQIGRAHV